MCTTGRYPTKPVTGQHSDWLRYEVEEDPMPVAGEYALEGLLNDEDDPRPPYGGQGTCPPPER